MAAGFHTFDDDGIRSAFLYTLSQLNCWNDGQGTNTCLVERGDIRGGIACTDGYKRNLFIAHQLSDIILVWSLKHQIDAKYCTGTAHITYFMDIVLYFIYSETATGADTGPACVINRSGQL